jgi:ATP-dependent exoDNAse (exonuclease V) beta subunit
MGKLIAEARGEVLLSADIIDYYAATAEAFLAQLYEMTDIYRMAASLPDPAAVEAKLDFLLEKAATLPLAGFSDLFSYIEGIAAAKDLDVEFVRPLDLSNDAVVLMTMHKAKGLEFDLAIVVLERGWGRSLKLDAAKGPHLRRGEGPHRRWVMELPSQEVCDAVPELAAEMEKVRQEASLANLCLYYVAMTRAKQALFVILPPVKEPKSRGAKKGKEESDGEA